MLYAWKIDLGCSAEVLVPLIVGGNISSVIRGAILVPTCVSMTVTAFGFVSISISVSTVVVAPVPFPLTVTSIIIVTSVPMA